MSFLKVRKAYEFEEQANEIVYEFIHSFIHSFIETWSHRLAWPPTSYIASIDPLVSVLAGFVFQFDTS